MRKFVRKVTMTGVDQWTDLKRLKDISDEFRFVEWGVLLSQSRMGSDNRYPTIDVIDKLLNLGVTVSGHVCGRWSREFMVDGYSEFVTAFDQWLHLFSRLQFNGNINTINETKFRAAVDEVLLRSITTGGRGITFILQVAEQLPSWWDRIANVDYLFDMSGGRGVLPNQWPSSQAGNFGYAGGLSPDNIIEQLSIIHDKVSSVIWVDAESGIRTSDVFDLDKVVSFLKQSERYVI